MNIFKVTLLNDYTIMSKTGLRLRTLYEGAVNYLVTPESQEEAVKAFKKLYPKIKISVEVVTPNPLELTILHSTWGRGFIRVILNGQEVGTWDDEANCDYPEDLTWGRMISELFYEGVAAGKEQARLESK